MESRPRSSYGASGSLPKKRAQKASRPNTSNGARQVFRSLREQPDYAAKNLSDASARGSKPTPKRSPDSSSRGGHSVRSVLASLQKEEEQDMMLQMHRQAMKSQLAKTSASSSYAASKLQPVRSTRPTSSKTTIARGREAASTALQAARSSITPTLSSNSNTGLNAVEQEELQQYGDSNRVPPGYTRQKLLGKGGCAAVWLARSPSGEMVALKQVVRTHKGNSSAEHSIRSEVESGQLIQQLAGVRGYENIIQLKDCTDTRSDLFCIFELGGQCLTKHLFEMKGEFVNGARVYRVFHQPFYQKLKRSHRLADLKSLFRQMFQALEVLRELNMVHADIKPENILVREQDYGGGFVAQLCDFGSSTIFLQGRVGVATPEYMPPEALRKNSIRSMGRGDREEDPGHSWSYDVWSLGAIFLEMVVGAPLWLSYKARVVDEDGKSFYGTGLFAAGARDTDKIITKQADTLRKLLSICTSKTPGVGLAGHLDGYELLECMLTWDPCERIRPDEALLSPFLQN